MAAPRAVVIAAAASLRRRPVVAASADCSLAARKDALERGFTGTFPDGVVDAVLSDRSPSSAAPLRGDESCTDEWHPFGGRLCSCIGDPGSAPFRGPMFGSRAVAPSLPGAAPRRGSTGRGLFRRWHVLTRRPKPSLFALGEATHDSLRPQ